MNKQLFVRHEIMILTDEGRLVPDPEYIWMFFENEEEAVREIEGSEVDSQTRVIIKTLSWK